jgi:poly-gamma-glutamate synthesis protein (capsule biosynthesis protein)
MAAGETLSIVAVGDLVPGRPLFPDDQPGSPSFAATVDVLRSADLAFGDLEMPLSLRGTPREKTIAFRTAPERAADLRRMGFDVLSLANNHIMDYGDEAIADTLRTLHDHQIHYIGAGQNLATALAPVIVERKGWRVGFLAFSCLLPTGAAAAPDRPGVAPIHVRVAYEVDPYGQMEEPGLPPIVRTWTDPSDQELAENCVRRLRGQVDFLVVSAHWGYGSGDQLAEYQRPLGHALVDAGADVIFGNHVHATHGIEVYHGKAILYSPGNCIAQQPREGISAAALAILDEMSPDGYLARLDVTADRLYRVHLLPIWTNREGLPEAAHDAVWRRIAERLQRLSARLGTELRVHGTDITVPLPA